MENIDECILIQQKEYDELKRKIRELERLTKPRYIQIYLKWFGRSMDVDYNSDFTISDNIRNIIYKTGRGLLKKCIDMSNEAKNSVLLEYFLKYKKMSWSNRRHLLKHIDDGGYIDNLLKFIDENQPIVKEQFYPL